MSEARRIRFRSELCGTRSDGEVMARRRRCRRGMRRSMRGAGGEAGGPGDDHLYLGHDGRAEGRDADAWQPGQQLHAVYVPFGFDETDSCISFLPLSHVTARHLDYALMCDGATMAYCPKFDQLAAAMEAVRPTILVAVPRVYEKIRQGVEGKSHRGEEADSELGAGGGQGAPAGDADGQAAGRAELEAGGQAGVLEDSRGVWRAGGDVRLGRRAAGDGYGGMVRRCGDSDLRGLWADGDLAGDCAEYAGSSTGLGRWGRCSTMSRCGLRRMASWRCAGRRSSRATGTSRQETAEAFTAGWLVLHRRHRQAGGWLPLDHRPQEGAAEDQRRQADCAAAD